MARTKRSTLTEGHKHWMLHRIVAFINADVAKKNDFERAYFLKGQEAVVESRGRRFRLKLTEIRS